MKTIILGLDGANWELLERWIEDGLLPNIKSLREEGTWGHHQSELPPTTFPNWKCYSTGTDPGQLGVYWFEMINLESKELKIPDATSFQGKELWNHLNDYGLDVGVINMPTMYPPQPIDGFVICGGPGTSDSVYRKIETEYTFPRELEDELQERDYDVHPKPLLASRDDEEAVEAIHDILNTRLKLLKDKIDDADVIHTTLFYLNVLQHFFWDEEPTENAWKLIDEHIGDLKDYCDENGHNLVLMSDHGCEEIHTKFFINRWLEQEGYYARKQTSDDLLRKTGFTRESLLSIAKRLRLESLIKYVPDRLQRLIPHEEGVVRERKLEIADLDETIAIASGQGPIYLNLEPGTEAYEETREEIIGKLEQLESPYNGEALLKNVYRVEELYEELNGPAPDIIISQNSGVTVSDRVGEGDLFTKPEKWRAENKQQGLIVFYGPNFITQDNPVDLHLIDISPTLFNAITGQTIDVTGETHQRLTAPPETPLKETEIFNINI